MNPYREMLDYIREHGWCKHLLENDNGQVCLFGAGRNTYAPSGYSILLSEIITTQFPDRVDKESSVPAFNDHPDTTQADIELVLEKAAASWDEHGA